MLSRNIARAVVRDQPTFESMMRACSSKCIREASGCARGTAGFQTNGPTAIIVNSLEISRLTAAVIHEK